MTSYLRSLLSSTYKSIIASVLVPSNSSPSREFTSILHHKHIAKAFFSRDHNLNGFPLPAGFPAPKATFKESKPDTGGSL